MKIIEMNKLVKSVKKTNSDFIDFCQHSLDNTKNQIMKPIVLIASILFGILIYIPVLIDNLLKIIVLNKRS